MMILAGLCLLAGLGIWIGYTVGHIHGLRGRACSPRAVTAAFNEFRADGRVSERTRRWLETGVRPR